MFDSGHTHGPTAHFVSDCPLCQAAKDARNRAIAHLTEALYLFNGLRPEGEQPTLRLNLAPINLTGDDTGLCHSFDITSKQGEILADAIDSMNAYAGAQALPISRALPSTAAQFAAEHPDIAGWIADAFEEIFAENDPQSFLNDVFTAPDPERAGLAYEDLLGGDVDGDVL
jgi:hypothetical protein